jgi:hypothetical protein
MSKLATTAAIIALVATSAMAKAPAFRINAGQYLATTQYTALLDSSGLCGSVAGLAAGQTTSAVATFLALGDAWTETIATTNGAGTTASPYGVSWVNCQFAPLPAAASWIAKNIGTATAPVYTYTATPTTPNVSTCVASSGIDYTLTAGNDTVTLPSGATVTQTLTYFGLPTNAVAASGTTPALYANDTGFKITTTNSALAVGGNTACFLSIDSLFLATQK